MTYSILVRVNNSKYNKQKFFLYKSGEENLTVFSLAEAETVVKILETCPKVFSEIKIVPRNEEEIKLLEDFWGANGRDLDFAFEMVTDECNGILDLLAVLDYEVSGIDYEETRRQIDCNE